jgi:hypothetical protein
MIIHECEGLIKKQQYLEFYKQSEWHLIQKDIMRMHWKFVKTVTECPVCHLLLDVCLKENHYTYYNVEKLKKWIPYVENDLARYQENPNYPEFCDPQVHDNRVPVYDNFHRMVLWRQSRDGQGIIKEFLCEDCGILGWEEEKLPKIKKKKQKKKETKKVRGKVNPPKETSGKVLFDNLKKTKSIGKQKTLI